MKTLLTTLLLTFNFAFAHEGHDKAPGTVAAPHGGVMKGTSAAYIEIVPTKDGADIFTFDHEKKPLPMKDVKLTATVAFPKKKGSQSVTLIESSDRFQAKVDAKGAHRYTLNLTVAHGSKNEKVSFTVEPQ